MRGHHHDRLGMWRPPFPPPGFGPGGPGGPGPEHGDGPGFGPGFGFGPGGPRRHFRGGGRGRPNVRAAVLALLLDRPMHGYEMITELESRTGGAWRPSPGSIYPTLQLLEDEGLIVSEEESGRKRFSLTDTGRTAAEADPTPWAVLDGAGREDWHKVRDAAFGAMNALRQVMISGNEEQRRRAVEVVDEARRKLYGILAD